MKSQIPGGNISKGTTVQFSVRQGIKGPEAEAVRPVEAATNMLAPVAVMPSTLPIQYSPIVAPYSGPPAQIFYGTVKSFNEDKGWGHITCAETQAIYGKDMFVLRS